MKAGDLIKLLEKQDYDVEVVIEDRNGQIFRQFHVRAETRLDASTSEWDQDKAENKRITFKTWEL